LNPLVISLVLLAAALHATWNAMVKASTERLRSMTLLSLVTGIAAAVVLPFLPAPARGSWPFIVASVAIHSAYNLLLVRMYAAGEFGHTYPIARGSSPVLVSLGAFLVAGELLTPLRLSGVVMVSGGIMALAFQGGRVSLSAALPAFATGVSIAAYSVVDGLGARASGAPLAYSAWMFLGWAVVMVLLYVLRRDTASLVRGGPEMRSMIVGGVIGLVGYTVVIWAMSVTDMGAVSALRETSVVMAAVIARVFLHERLAPWRIGACAVIAAGAIMLSV
jgi:drug/metabolite transporter (DMT)-like permease